MRILNQIKTWLIGLAFCALIIAISPILIPVVLVMQLRSSISLRSFRRREAGRFYLVCTSKRNWHDFLLNNVIPILPDNVKVVWHKSDRGKSYPELQAHLSQSKIWGVSKPYLVAITKHALLVKSLNGYFQDIKSNRAVSDHVRAICSRRIEAYQTELLTMRHT